MEDPDKVLLPSRDLVLVAFGEDKSIDRIPFTLLDNPPLDCGHGSAVGNADKWVTLGARYRPGSRSKLSNRIEDGLVELIQLFSL